MSSLKDRVNSYAELTDYKIMPKLPLIICVNGKGFSNLTNLLDKPYDHKFAECMLSTMLRLATEVEGAIFSYQFNDEIVIISRNDQGDATNPWFGNRLQKICSVASSYASTHFHDCSSAINLNLMGDPIFTSQVFAAPTIAEAINVLVYKQQQNFLVSLQLACFYELLKKYDKTTIKEMLAGLSSDEKISLLKQECEVDFNNYPQAFRRGAACYKVPKVTEGGLKNVWTLNYEAPIFTRDQSFLSNIFKNGADIFREP